MGTVLAMQVLHPTDPDTREWSQTSGTGTMPQADEHELPRTREQEQDYSQSSERQGCSNPPLVPA